MKLWFYLILSVVILTGCWLDPQTTKIQYVPDMADNPTVKAQEDYLDPPEGSVSMLPVLYAKTLEEAEKKPMPSWVGGGARNLSKGKDLYLTFCIPCHGPEGKGDGLVGKDYQPLKPPDITSGVYPQKSDGFYFHKITFGSAIMQGYGHAIAPHERWLIVQHIRELQK